ncbi:MAG: prolyl oligopeptidase family serine peptidase, partial [Bacteroidales bacterium]|nr:prolyl oligopeptidase family serine peptidase [Bacteroidales bacterium]
ATHFNPVDLVCCLKDYKGRKGISANSTRFGKPERLTAGAGWHEPLISRDRKWLLDIWSSVDLPLAARVVNLSNGKEKLSLRMDNPLSDFANVEVDFGSVKSADGRYDNYYRLLKPLDFDPEKKYPVVVYVYGGPHSQMVRDSWLGEIRYWEFLMAQRGYIVYAQDNRGTENRGLEYEQAIHRHCGQAEMADQMEGVKMLKSLPYVDADRIGVHGWSYGGFMTISLITTYPDVFKVAVAGGPVIDWKWYEVMYGERYMETEATNPEGFSETSLINKAKDLKGKLLICQGAIDNTCVWQHSLNFVRACIDANVQLDYFPYPLSEHNMTGKTRVHLMDKVTEYFDNNL